MHRTTIVVFTLLALTAGRAGAWSNHSVAAYRVFEQMPEVASAAPVRVEPLEVFLQAQAGAIEQLLTNTEAWGQRHLDVYPVTPSALVFKVNVKHTDAERRLAFLSALRVAPDSKWALYLRVDPTKPPPDPARALPLTAISTLPGEADSSARFTVLRPGDSVTALQVLATACDEPDYGLDINLWEDSPTAWGKAYGFGRQPFGNPALNYATQAPFHMGFFHEDRVIYWAADFVRRTYPLLRIHQYTELATLAFRSGHSYWGWRFTGLALHYLQDLTQPYHASLSPGSGSLKLVAINALAMVGMPRLKNEMIVLLSNRHLALERYQNQLLERAAQERRTSPREQALADASLDARHPAWSDRYVRDVVARQAQANSARVTEILLDTLPARYVSDPAFDFGANETGIDLIAELAKTSASTRERLDAAVAELLGNFGAHSRNLVRGVLKAGANP